MKEMIRRGIRFIVILAVLNIIIYKLGETLGDMHFGFWKSINITF